MKQLKNFLSFDWDAFANDKEFTVTNVTEWTDFNSKEHLGRKVEAIITADKTEYHSWNGEVVSNLGEKIVFKVREDVTLSAGDIVRPLNPKVKAYGVDKVGELTNAFINRLAIECESIEVV